MTSRARFSALFLLCLAAPAAALQPAAETEQPAPASAEPPASAVEPIVVTGTLPLVVDLEAVALRCLACRRALGRLQAAAAQRRPGSAPRAVEEIGPSSDGRLRPAPVIGVRPAVDVTSASAAGMMRYTEQETRARVTARESSGPRQPRVETQANHFERNLMRLVGPIVDRLIVERRAPAAYAAADPAARGLATTDVTQAVIEALDRDHANVDLLARPQAD